MHVKSSKQLDAVALDSFMLALPSTCWWACESVVLCPGLFLREILVVMCILLDQDPAVLDDVANRADRI